MSWMLLLSFFITSILYSATKVQLFDELSLAFLGFSPLSFLQSHYFYLILTSSNLLPLGNEKKNKLFFCILLTYS